MTLTLSPDATLLLFTAGVLLICIEFNRPSLILPGACGLALSLLAIARLISLPMPRLSAEACVLAGVVLLASFRVSPRLAAWPWVRVAMASATFLLIFFGFGNVTIPAPATRTHGAVTLGCALLLGGGTSFLTTIAARARQNKGLDLK